MNPIQYALNRLVKYGIPKPILAVAFISRFATPYDSNLYTIESKIREEVIYGRVVEDMNLTYGQMITIPLSQCTRLRGDNYTTVWQVPKSLTQNKSIISISEVTAASGNVVTIDGGIGSSVAAGVTTATSLGYNNYGAIMGAAQQVANSVLPVPIVSNALVYLIGDNTICIKDATAIPSSMHIRVFVEMDTNLNHIQSSYYMTFYELVLRATESYIYNNIVLEQDNAFIASGGELNKFKEIVDGFADSEETYKELIEEWSQCGILNDPESQRQHYQLTAGGGW